MSEAVLDAGTTALADGRWAEARSAFEAVLATADLPRAHDGLAEALWWLGEPQASLVHRERALVGFRRAGQDSAAAAAAIEACVVHLINFGNGAAAAGWLARAETLAGAELQGWICLMRAFMSRDADEGFCAMRGSTCSAETVTSIWSCPHGPTWAGAWSPPGGSRRGWP